MFTTACLYPIFRKFAVPSSNVYASSPWTKIILALDAEIKAIRERFKRAKNKSGDTNFEI